MVKTNDFFCGAGGFGIGFKQAGFEIVGAWDFDEYAVQSYAHNVSNKVLKEDIQHLTGKDVPFADVWTFGFPCQDISISGKGAGMIKGKTRSGMFYEIMRLLGEVTNKPTFILAENVKNVRKLLPEIEKEYNLAGYEMKAILYNSKYWDVPQNRDRYFILGILKGSGVEVHLPEEDRLNVPALKSILEDNVPENYYYEDATSIQVIEHHPEGLKVRVANKKGYDIAIEGDTINILHPNSKTRRGRVGHQISQTLQTVHTQVVVERGLRVRKMTPREYARLQGFPESFEIIVTKTQAYKQFGNAVTVTVSKAIAEALKEALEG